MADDLHAAILIPGHKVFGQERALLDLAESLRRGGMRVTILLHSEWGRDYLAPALRERGLPFHFLPMNTIWSPGLLLRKPKDLIRNVVRVRAASHALSRLLDKEKFDAVVTGNWTFGAYVLPALKSSDVAFVYRHGDAPSLSNPLVREISRRVFAQADLHVVNCNYLEARLRDFYPVGKVRIIRNAAIGVERCSAPVSREVLPRHIVYAGQLSVHKGVLILLDAFDIIARAFPDVILKLAGSHPGVGFDVDPRIVTRLGQATSDWDDRVQYVGHVDSVSELFTPESIHVCPSIWDDPSPNVISEAKARQVPTVAFARGGIPEIIRSGVDGEIVPNETPQALAEALIGLLNSPEKFAAQRIAAGESLALLPNADTLSEFWVGAIKDAIGIRQRRYAK